MTNEEAIKLLNQEKIPMTLDGELNEHLVVAHIKAILALEENTKLKTEIEQLKERLEIKDNNFELYSNALEEVEQLKEELEQSVKCINDTWMFTEEIIDKAKKGDLSMFRITGISGCDMYQGCPPICRVHDSLFEKHEEIIHKSIRTVQEEAEQSLKG